MFQGFRVLPGWESVSVTRRPIAACVSYLAALPAAGRPVGFYLLVFMFHHPEATDGDGDSLCNTGVGGRCFFSP